jgi:phosphoglucomutase
MTLDCSGKVRMDGSLSYTMRWLDSLKGRIGVAWACDTDYDRHDIVRQSSGHLTLNYFHAVAIPYLFNCRPGWPAHLGH